MFGYHLGTGLVKEFRQSWIAYASWLLWLDRNDLLFNDHAKPVHVLFNSVHLLVMEQFACRLIEVMATDHDLLASWGIHPTFPNPKAAVLFIWELPLTGWIKLNFDGARKVDASIAGVGFFARSSCYTLIAAAGLPVLDCDINQIELIAAWNALVWLYFHFGAVSIWLEGDSKWVVNQLNHPPHPDDGPLLTDRKIFLSKMQAHFVSHIFREGNSGADLMANCGCFLDTFTLWESNFPSELVVIVERDRDAPYVRM